jgi:hypothetical protein
LNDPLDGMIAFLADSRHDSQSRGVIDMWTLYDHPADYPDGYIARKFEVSADGPVATLETLRTVGNANGLELMREAFGLAGYIALVRCQRDDSHIIETWV